MREVLLIFDKVLRDGFEGDAFLNGLASHYRDLLVCQDPRTLDLQDHSDTLRERYVNQASALSMSFVFSALNLLNQADVTYPQVSNKRLHVEMTLGKLCLINQAVTAAPHVEKKTADVSTPQPHPKPQPAKAAPVAKPEPTRQEPISDKTPEAETKPEPEVQKTAAPKQNPISPKTKTSFKRPDKLPPGFASIPKLGSLDDVREKIEETERQARANRQELTTEGVQAWWNKYQEGITSPSVQATFNATTISLQENTIVLEVNSQMAKTRILEETALLATMRKDFHQPNLQIDFVVHDNPELHEKPKKLMTNKEKYELLVNKNPGMKELKNSLDLIVDQDD